jgi:prolyl oligopeptidase
MLKSSLFLVSFSIFFSHVVAQVTYPVTKKVNQSDIYFGVKVEDPYRWLENDSSDEVKNWVKEENKVTNSYLTTIPFREKIRQRIKELNDVLFAARQDELENIISMYLIPAFNRKMLFTGKKA